MEDRKTSAHCENKPVPRAGGDRSARGRKLFRAEQLSEYAESRVYLFGPSHTGFLIGLRLGTDRPSGTIITDWTIEPPWPGHRVCWDYEARDFIPKQGLKDYTELLDSRLMGVLNDHRRLRRGHPRWPAVWVLV